MSNIPYLMRRGEMLALRIAVPIELRRFVGCREIVRSLRTADRQAAIPQALELAATVKRLFFEIRTSMSQSDDEKIRAIVQHAKHKLELNDLREQHEAEIITQRRQITHEIKAARLEAENEALKLVLGNFMKSGIPTLPQPQENEPEQQVASAPTLKEVVEGVKKSVKTGDARKVPIHGILIELGLLEYVKVIKDAGAKRLFPAWEPMSKRASGNAEKWFRQFLRDTGLRDDTPKRKLLGMHAFRHTILTHGVMQKPSLNLTPITGHAQNIEGIDGAAKGYLDMVLINSLTDLKVLIDQLAYEVEFYRPA